MTQAVPHQPPMSFGTAVSTVFGKYAQFEGRASRPEFWWFILFTAIVSAALSSLNIATPNGTIGIARPRARSCAGPRGCGNPGPT